MTDADKLAQVLAEHDCYRWRFYLGGPDDAIVCTCGTVIPEQDAGYAEDWHRTHVAAVVLAHLTAEGWAQTVAEEWGVYRPELNDHNVINMGERGQADAVAKMSNRRESGRGGSHVVRRRVTDWEEA